MRKINTINYKQTLFKWIDIIFFQITIVFRIVEKRMSEEKYSVS